MNPIPHFEGRPVDHAQVKVSGTAPMDDLDDVVLSIDDAVQMVSTFRCIDVNFKVDEKTGQLVRIHVLKPVEMALHPFDVNDPSDDGILRAIPRPVMGEIESGEDQ